MGHKTTSIHVVAVKASAGRHFDDEHREKLDYIRNDRIDLNESWKENPDVSLLQRRIELAEIVKKETGRGMQKKATPIRDGVVVVSDETTMDDLHELAAEFEKLYKIKTIEIYLHEDEGFTDPDTEVWKQNRHAHMIFDWLDHKTGKSIKLAQHETSEMQDVCARVLKMKRGTKVEYSDGVVTGRGDYKRKVKNKEAKRHLAPKEWKRKQEHLRTKDAKQSIVYNSGRMAKFRGDVHVKSTIKSVHSIFMAKDSQIDEAISKHESDIIEHDGVVSDLQEALRRKSDENKQLQHDIYHEKLKRDSLEKEKAELKLKLEKELSNKLNAAYEKGGKDKSDAWHKLTKKSRLKIVNQAGNYRIIPMTKQETQKIEGPSMGR